MGLGVLTSAAIVEVLPALVPEPSGRLFHTTDHLVGGLSVFALAGPVAVSQVVFAGPPYVVTSVAGGAGFGVAFLGSLRALSGAIPPEQRGAVMSAF